MLVLHSDNGAPMRAWTMQARLKDLGVVPSFSRPAVSNDNPFSESLFRTLKNRPTYPDHCFESLEDARQWVSQFVEYYNKSHRHSALKFLTPHQRHSGHSAVIMAKRKAVLERMKAKRAERWSGPTRNWTLSRSVKLNPGNTQREGSHDATSHTLCS